MMHINMLNLPLGAFLKWRFSRFVLQLPLLAVTLLAVYDGLTGSQIAPKNLATTSVWLHYRGLVALSLVVLGNLFCAACPLMLTRGPSKFLKRYVPQFRWPRRLKNKWLVVFLTCIYLFCYEYFGLWSSPWLTAWLILGYFAASLTVDTVFPAGTFCKYVCPLGNFNFALSQVSPTQIQAVDPNVCLSCTGKYCLNGRQEKIHFPGCETQLFVPSLQSNTDCTLCMNCLRACPHNNVAWTLNLNAFHPPKPKPDWAWMGLLLLFGGMINAFAMTTPYTQWVEMLSQSTGIRHSEIWLGVTLSALFVLGWISTRQVVFWSQRLLGQRGSFNHGLRQFGSVFFPLSAGIWCGHSLYHLLTGFWSFIPIFQSLVSKTGWISVTPQWEWAGIVPENGLFPLQVAVLYIGYGISLYITFGIARQNNRLTAGLPLALLLTVCAILTLMVFAQPMQMRGSILGG